jgi:RNA polymerase sigma-70 factor, ECF subfamily
MAFALRLPALTAFGARESINHTPVDGWVDALAELTEEMADRTAGTPDFAREVLVHESALRARAQKLCKSEADADDLVQDTLERALNHYPKLKDRNNIRGWLLTIMSRLFVDRVRHEKIARLVEFGPEHDIGHAPPEPPRHEAIEWDDVAAALPRLPAQLREVVELRVQRMAYADIAQQLGIPTNTVATRIRRAIEELGELLGISREEDEDE